VSIFWRIQTNCLFKNNESHLVWDLQELGFPGSRRCAWHPHRREVQVIDASTSNRLLLRIHRPTSGPVIVPLVARSNTAYQLPVQAPKSVQFRVVAVRPFGGTEHLMPSAESVHVTGPMELANASSSAAAIEVLRLRWRREGI
jgi:hypothetical protein